jgi:iron-sulfur cluster assembly protein
MNYAESVAKFDEEIVDRGVRIFIEPAALMKIAGTVMDWKESEVAAEFVFTNPNAKGVCGCGESFNT